MEFDVNAQNVEFPVKHHVINIILQYRRINYGKYYGPVLFFLLLMFFTAVATWLNFKQIKSLFW